MTEAPAEIAARAAAIRAKSRVRNRASLGDVETLNNYVQELVARLESVAGVESAENVEVCDAPHP